MEGGAQGDIAIVNAIGVESDMRGGSTATEEIHSAALAHHLDRFFPCFGDPYSFNGDIDAAVLWRERTRFANGFANAGGLYHVCRA